MIQFLRFLAGIATGMAVAFATVILVEIYSGKVHPLPPAVCNCFLRCALPQEPTR